MPLYYNSTRYMEIYHPKTKCFYEKSWLETCCLRKSEDECSKEAKLLELCLQRHHSKSNKK